MIAFACEEPATNSSNCESNCKGKTLMMYGYALRGPTLVLPEDVAFIVGEKTNLKYILVNIHYQLPSKIDRSGVALTFSSKP
jgi:hypothetical protein